MRRSSLFVIAGFLVVLLGAEAGARALAPHLPRTVTWDTEFSQAKAEDALEWGQTDVVFVGSSIVNASIDPALAADRLGWANGAYNAGLPATTPRTWEVWLDDVVYPQLCPRLMVIGVGARDYNANNPGAAGRVARYGESAGRLAYLAGEPVSGDDWWSWSKLIELRSRLRDPWRTIKYLTEGEAPGWPSTDLTADGRYRGFDDRAYREVHPDRDETLAEGALSSYRAGGPEDQAVRSIVADAQARGVTVVLVEMPSMRTHLGTLMGGGEAQVDEVSALLDDIGADFDVPVLSYPDMDNEPSWFADLYHMRRVGTEEISTRLAADLADLVPEPPLAARCGS